ncbi:MAG: transketolase [Clostridia bacterium]|nr:transketolase [Clostridia bacterium]
MEHTTKRELELNAFKIRKHTLEMIRTANSGHIGGSFSIAEILSVLYFKHMKVDPMQPRMADRDRLVLSKGHCAPAMYSALAMKGFFPTEDLACFRRIDGYLSGHVEMTHVPGVDMSSGSLGQGLSVGVGMALSAKLDQRDYTTYVILGDGELEEGQIWEAVMSAAKYKLDHLVAIVDCNRLQLDSSTADIMPMEPLDQKFAAFGWHVIRIDGHDVEKLSSAFTQAKTHVGQPTVIIADTVKGKGVSVFENQLRFHGGRPTADEYRIAFDELNAKIAQREV